MATRLKPSRINVDNTPRVGEGASYKTDDDFHWSMGGGDMAYEDFTWQTLTGSSVTIEKISNNITPSSDFTVAAGTVKPGITYTLRVNVGSTPYTMTLGTGVTNPNGYATTLEANTVSQFRFIATSDSQLELELVDSSIKVELDQKLDHLVILSYGSSTWSDFINAYNKNALVYCRASSGTNPGTGTMSRMAFMAYVNDPTTPTEVEFQYYRSVATHSDSQQGDQVFIYKLNNTNGGTWTNSVREASSKIAVGTGITKTYSSGTITLANDGVLTVNGSKGTVTVNDIKVAASAPSNPTAGVAWYDTTNGALKVYNGSTWDTIATGGAISDTAYGPGWDGQTTTAPSQNAVYDKISSIDALIPSEATSSNKLADKAYVGDSINSVTAYYITKNAQGDQFATYAELAAATTFYSGGVARVPTRNDYTIVLADENHDNATTRYIYNSGWEYQYTINETPLTQAQLDALNSGITAGKVSTYDGYATSKQDKLVNQTNIKSINNNSLLGSGNLTLNDVKVSSTAPSSPTEGMVWYDTTNDQLKVYDGSNWDAVENEYNAGEGILIGTVQDYSAMQGPALKGYHIPQNSEWTAIIEIWKSLGGGASAGNDFLATLKMPKLGYLQKSDGAVNNENNYGYYWTCTSNTSITVNHSAYYLQIYNNNITIKATEALVVPCGMPVRCFKDTPVTPDSSWTKLYGTSIESGGIFHNSSFGLISLSSDGETWITIQDKNIGATQVYNSGDTKTKYNCGGYLQRGNNYVFEYGETLTTSSTQVDASNYGPGNYYSSSTFITTSSSPNDRSSVRSDNLWGGETGVVTIQNAITNTGVLSVNGETGDVIVDLSEASGVTTTPPANPVAGNVYYDTTNNALMIYDGTQWIAAGAVTSVNGQTGAVTVNEVPSTGTTGNVLTKTASGYEFAAPAASGIISDPNSPTTITKMRAGTKAQFNSATTEEGVIYNVY